MKYQTQNEQGEEEDDEDEDEEEQEEARGGAVGCTEMTPEPSLSSFDRAKPARSQHQTAAALPYMSVVKYCVV